MCRAPGKLGYVQSNLELYEQGAESWKADHGAAMACYEFEDFLEYGIEIFESISSLDEAWRLRVFKRQVSYDADLESRIHDCYRKWLEPCADVEQVLQWFESRFGELRRAEEFRARRREAQGILANDSEFFAGDALARLRDDAIDEHRRGEALDDDRQEQ